MRLWIIGNGFDLYHELKTKRESSKTEIEAHFLDLLRRCATFEGGLISIDNDA